jgi:hypothetical protein
MSLASLHGPYVLDEANLLAHLRQRKPGTFAVGRYTANGFEMMNTGRSDTDLGESLRPWIGHWPHFKFRYFESARAAFHKECELYHDFLGARQPRLAHPVRAVGTDWSCPRCGAG